MRRWIAPLFTSVVLLGCQQNPFPASDRLSVNPPPPHDHQKPSPIPAYTLTVPDVMVFREKEEREYSIQAAVPSPGRAIVTVPDLPKGAHFSQDSLRFSWMPMSVPTGQNPLVVHFILQSSEDPILTYEHSAVLVVQSATPLYTRKSPFAQSPQITRIGTEVRIPFSVEPGPSGEVPLVRIEPAAAVSEVQWQDQELIFTPSSPGLKTFQAIVTLSDGEERRQEFSFWVVQ